MPHHFLAAPGINDLRMVRSGVCVCHHRILPGGIEIRRLDHRRFHHKTIAGVDLKHFNLAEVIAAQSLDGILFNDGQHRAFRRMRPHLRRRLRIRSSNRQTAWRPD